MQRLTCVAFVNLAHYGKRPAVRVVHSRFRSCTSLVPKQCDRGIWPGNETTCAHAYNIRKWRPAQRTATTECCEWLLSTRVNLRL